MKNNKILLGVLVLIVILGFIGYVSTKNKPVPPGSNPVTATSSAVTYSNTEYGFNFSLPGNWEGYSIVKNTWNGTALKKNVAQSGPKLLIRNPKWTAAAPYEDLPVLVFTISQWNAYLAEDFTVSAAPIMARELARNNKYVFALPPRWDFDYSLDVKEAEDIIASNPLHPFNIGISQGKLNIDVVCTQALAYMTFPDAKSSQIFIADCKEGKHPEVIEKYKADMNLGEGATI